MLPQGSGAQNGTGFQNALNASRGGLQKCWDLLEDGDTCHVGPGEYKNAVLVIVAGGSPGSPKTLAGPGSGKPAVFLGNWKIRQADQGLDFATLKPGADHVRIRNIAVHRYRYGIQTERRGRVDDLHISGVDLENVRIGVEIYGDENCSFGEPGGKGCPNPENASHGLLLENIRVRGASKIGIRLRYGVYDAVLRDCHVDLGGIAYDKDPGGDHVGFSIGDGKSARERSPDRNITFENCTARNAYNDRGQEYWQGDGFKTEQYSTGVRFVKCGAFDNTDGGFDVKGPGTVLENCVAARNKRNFRLWNVTGTPGGRALLKNCLGHHAKFWGDKHSTANLHLFGDAVVQNSTFHNTIGTPEATDVFGAYGILQENRTSLPSFTTVLENCVVSRDARSSSGSALIQIAKQKDKTSDFRFVDTLIWDALYPEQGSDPDYAAPRDDFEGGSSGFDSRAFGPGKGYRDPG